MSVQDDEAVQTIVAMASPTGRVVKSSIPTQATPRRASPTHTPVPSSTNSTARKTAMAAASLTASLRPRLGGDVRPGLLPLGHRCAPGGR